MVIPNANVHVYGPVIFLGSVDCTITALVLEHTVFCLMSSGENSAHCLQLEPVITVQHLSLHQVPITV